MKLDRRTLDLAAPVLCTLASVVSLWSALRRRDHGAAIVSGLLGAVGSAAWALAALDDDPSIGSAPPRPGVPVDGPA